MMSRFAYFMDRAWILISVLGLLVVSMICLFIFPSSEVAGYTFIASAILLGVLMVVNGIFVLTVIPSHCIHIG